MPTSYGVVEQLYLEPDGAAALDWQYQAACAGVDTNAFFTAGGGLRPKRASSASPARSGLSASRTRWTGTG